MRDFKYIPDADRYIPKPVIRTEEEIQIWEDEIKDLTISQMNERHAIKMQPLNDYIRPHRTWEPFRSYH